MQLKIVRFYLVATSETHSGSGLYRYAPSAFLQNVFTAFVVACIKRDHAMGSGKLGRALLDPIALSNA